MSIVLKDVKRQWTLSIEVVSGAVDPFHAKSLLTIHNLIWAYIESLHEEHCLWTI